MSDLKYIKIGDPETKAIEECSEVIKAICKGQRFGWLNFHPDRPDRTNAIKAIEEMTDAVVAFECLADKLQNLTIRADT